MSVTNWGRIRQRAGSNPEFPGFKVYCYGSFQNMSKQWYLQFVTEAQSEGLAVAVFKGNVYVLDKGDE